MTETQILKKIQEQHFTKIADIARQAKQDEENYIIANRVKCNGQKVRIATKNKFFATDVICKVRDEEIEFSHPTLNYRGRTTKPNAGADGWYRLDISAEIPEGKYLISADSDEDFLFIEL